MTDYKICKMLINRINRKARGRPVRHKHHTVQVVKNLAWHIDNLWNYGWNTQVEIEPGLHDLVHNHGVKHGKTTQNHNASIQAQCSWNFGG